MSEPQTDPEDVHREKPQTTSREDQLRRTRADEDARGPASGASRRDEATDEERRRAARDAERRRGDGRGLDDPGEGVVPGREDKPPIETEADRANEADARRRDARSER